MSTSAAAQISPETWSHILSFCVAVPPPDADKKTRYGFVPQKTLAAALRVNTTFYLAAAPHLYRSPVIINISSFLLGADRPIPPDPSSSPSTSASGAAATPAVHSHMQSDLFSLRNGNSKLPLLRHVRQLAIVYDRPDLPRHPPDIPSPISRGNSAKMREFLQDFQDGTEKAINHLTRMNKLYESASRTLYRLPISSTDGDGDGDGKVINPMPQLVSVRIGKPLFYPEPTSSIPFHMNLVPAEQDEMDIVPDLERFAPLLVRTVRPKYWCEHIPGSVLNIDRPVDSSELPSVVSLHLDSEEECSIVWGTTNRVYLGWSKQPLPNPDNANNPNSLGAGNGDEDMSDDGSETDSEYNWEMDSAGEVPSEFADDHESYGYGDEDSDDDDDSDMYESDSDGGGGGGGADRDALFEEDEVVQLIAGAIEDSYPNWLQYACQTKRQIDKSTTIEIYGVERMVMSPFEGRGKEDDGDEWEDMDDGEAPTAAAAGGRGKSKVTIEIVSEDPIPPPASTSTSTSKEEEEEEEAEGKGKEENTAYRLKAKKILKRMQKMVREEVWDRLADMDWQEKGAKGGPTIVLKMAGEAPVCQGCGLNE